jgi:hypothetical protein
MQYAKLQKGNVGIAILTLVVTQHTKTC